MTYKGPVASVKCGFDVIAHVFSSEFIGTHMDNLKTDSYTAKWASAKIRNWFYTHMNFIKKQVATSRESLTYTVEWYMCKRIHYICVFDPFGVVPISLWWLFKQQITIKSQGRLTLAHSFYKSVVAVQAFLWTCAPHSIVTSFGCTVS